MFGPPRLFVNVYELTYVPGPDEFSPVFEITRTNQRQTFLMLVRCEPKLESVPASILGGLDNIPLTTILSLEAAARGSWPDDWPEALRRVHWSTEVTHLILDRNDIHEHYFAAAPPGLAFKLANLHFAAADGSFRAERDEPTDLVSVDLARLPL